MPEHLTVEQRRKKFEVLAKKFPCFTCQGSQGFCCHYCDYTGVDWQVYAEAQTKRVEELEDGMKKLAEEMDVETDKRIEYINKNGFGLYWYGRAITYNECSKQIRALLGEVE